MDCPSISPILLSDMDMDILTDTLPPPWTQWNTISEHVPVPPFPHNTFAPDSIWKTPVQEPPPPTTQYNSGFAAPNAPSFDRFVCAAPEPPAPPIYHPCPLYAMSDRIQDTAKVPRRITTPHPSSIATLLDEFERSLMLVADESPSFETDNQSDYNRHFKLTPPRIIEDERRIHLPRTNDSLATLALARSDDHPDDPHPFEMEVIEPLGEGQVQIPACFLTLHEPPSLPFKRESTAQPPGDPPPFERKPNVPLKKGPPACFLDLAGRPQPPVDQAPSPTYTQPASPRAPRASHPLTRPRPPTPRHNTRTTYPSALRLASTSKTDRAELPVAQASVPAGKSTQLPPPFRAEALGDDELGGDGGRSGWGVPLGRRTPLGASLRAPAPVQCSRRRREEAEEGEGKARRVHTKRTRFVVPGTEDEGDEDARASPGAHPRWTSADSTRRTSGPGPLRSILRNKHATPYDDAMVRRASVP